MVGVGRIFAVPYRAKPRAGGAPVYLAPVVVAPVRRAGRHGHHPKPLASDALIERQSALARHDGRQARAGGAAGAGGARGNGARVAGGARRRQRLRNNAGDVAAAAGVPRAGLEVCANREDGAVSRDADDKVSALPSQPLAAADEHGRHDAHAVVPLLHDDVRVERGRGRERPARRLLLRLVVAYAQLRRQRLAGAIAPPLRRLFGGLHERELVGALR